MRTVRLLLVLLVLATFGVASAQDPVQITLGAWSSSELENAALEDMIAAFEEANPDVDVELVISPEYDTFMQTGFASGDYPNVFYVDSNKLQDWASAGVLEPLGDRVEASEGIYESLRNAFTFEDQFYCPPKDFSTLGLVYNTDMFEAAGVEVPQTWEEFAAAAEALTTGEGEDKTYGLVIEASAARFLPWVYSYGGAVFDEEGVPNLNTEETAAGLQAFVDLFRNGYAATFQDVGAGWAGEAFGRGDAAMTVEGNWIISYLEEQFPDTNWAVAELPEGPAGRSTMAFTVCYGVAAAENNEQLDASIRLVNFLTGEEGAMMVGEAGFGVMPARESASEAWLTARGEEFQPFVAGAEYAQRWSFPPGFGSFLDSFNNGVVEAVRGNADVADVLEDAQEAAQEAYEENQ
jgi:multiple sugar transport system substrate-binding protein